MYYYITYTEKRERDISYPGSEMSDNACLQLKQQSSDETCLNS